MILGKVFFTGRSEEVMLTTYVWWRGEEGKGWGGA